MIGGVQGSGVDTSATIFARAAASGGLHVFGKREYYSNIKGEHSYFQVRVSKGVIRSHVDTVDMLATFEEETIFRHALEVRSDGAIIYDPDQDTKRLDQIPTIETNVKAALNTELSQAGLSADVKGIVELARRRGAHIYPIPYSAILKDVGAKHGETSLSALQRMLNVVAVAASFALLGYDEDVVKASVRNHFRSKPKVAEMNADAVGAAYDHVEGKYAGSFSYKLSPTKPTDVKLFVRGNTVVAMAKEVAGCRFQTYYPITPASDESEYLEAHSEIQLDGATQNDPRAAEVVAMKKGSIAVVQSEDEIAAVTMAIGGGLAGVRSSTSTSGPGFSLMAEGLGYAGMNEVPVVVTLYSRGGPSTGLPTRHEQGDLRFALHAGHGEFPRFVLASGDLEEAFYDTVRAFNYSEKYQMPLIHIVDKALANSDSTMSGLDSTKVKIDRGAFLKEITTAVNGEFKRFQHTPTGISPRAPLGTKGGVNWYTGDEHDELGHISEDPTNRDYMMEKRMSKLDLADREIPMTERVNFFGPEVADITVVSWGSTKGAILDAMEWLKQDGVTVNFIQVRLVNPFPTEYVTKLLSRAKRVVGIEMNYSAQLIGIVREHTCIPIEQLVVKYNGRPMSSEEIYDSIKMIHEGKAPKKLVLKHGA
ncbi:MAG: 2-oxoacid:acceptor oxidoreductase subunit alpha [Nitrososphaerota archaeon]|jgi:2-oxoglutarate ferredoxin oxidoreductase subunit alpha|nr:2-oxoacid:acceptor oxidoreductase subunit alpha [Nitrososphaerota archaeon]MDG6943050.1 2-oxoacid:acceptor oxidoreductase subunit alpha [Nitrososphaerota archaeon]MDG6950779.1 2-oxoacid:acceptor oxidoreductase subunit alpha [Nitrososphaerota archaeon]